MDFDFLTHAPFWIALGQIIIIDILLGGDNAVVIALACRKLPPEQRRKGIIYGTAGAIILRVILIAFAMTLLALPALKLVGALLLVWIGIKLIAPDEEGHDNIQGSDKLFAAIKTIIVADLVMSVDNVIAIAGAAQSSGDHQLLLVTLGLLISIPIIIVGGGMLLGWIAGGMLVSDPLFVNPEKWTWAPKLLAADENGHAIFNASMPIYWAAHIGGALLVLVLGKMVAAKKAKAGAAH